MRFEMYLPIIRAIIVPTFRIKKTFILQPIRHMVKASDISAPTLIFLIKADILVASEQDHTKNRY